MNRRHFIRSIVAVTAGGMLTRTARAGPMATWQVSVTGYGSHAPGPHRLLWFRTEDLRERDFDQFSARHLPLAFAEDFVTGNGLYVQSATSSAVWCAVLMPGEYQWMTDPAAVAPDSGSISL